MRNPITDARMYDYRYSRKHICPAMQTQAAVNLQVAQIEPYGGRDDLKRLI